MYEAIASLFTLRWTQQRQFRPLPPAITRTFTSTPAGDLELLISKPLHPSTTAPPIFFIHGGCGHASVWLDWMQYLDEAGYGGTLYSYSARNHGASYTVPYLRMVYGTSVDAMADDLVACAEAAMEKEGGKDLVLVGHSSGGGLVQKVLAKGRLKARALCLLDAVPHFGNFCMYANWARHDPWFLLRSLFHLQHPNSPLSSLKLVHGAFFCGTYPRSSTHEFARWMPAYESMGWALGMAGSFWDWLRGNDRWLKPEDILKSVSSRGDAVCVMVGSRDMMLNARIWDRQVAELRDGVRQLRGTEAGESKPAAHEFLDGASIESQTGVQLVVVHGAGHHLQNDLQREIGAEALMRFARQCV